MINVLLVCSAGMSTSMLVQRTIDAAKKRGVEISISAMSEAEAKKHLDGCDVILLGPQVRFLLKGITKLTEGKNIKVDIINSVSYGRLDGNDVLSQILRMLE
ncbi:MAG: PTS sugar transporter subunit IIB [Clostridiales bacterium]|nr:PTS sugar transporter subunit IIB [Clostridiales bacterium]